MKKKILVVDDEPDIAKVLAVRLINYGFEVAVAHSAKAALERIGQDVPDLLILDIMMPDMTGAELAAELKLDRKTSQIPIIFISALLSKQDEQARGRLNERECILAKPYEIKELVLKINSILRTS